MSKNPLTCLQWLQDSIHLPNLLKAASESVVFMLLSVETMAAEEVEVSMVEDVTEDVAEDVEEV